jgi:hypothetical protein
MPRLPLPHPLVDRPFSCAEGIELGLGVGRLRGADLVAPHRGVRVPVESSARVPGRKPGPNSGSGSSESVVPEHARTLQPVMLGGWRFSHVTALALWGLPVPPRVDSGAEPLHVTTPTGRGPRRAGVVGHRAAVTTPSRGSVDSSAAVTPVSAQGSALAPRRSASAGPFPSPLVSAPILLDGLLLDDPLSAWVRSGALLSLDELIRVGDALAGSWSPHGLARRRGLDELVATVSEAGPIRGIAMVRQAMESVRAGVESPKETDLRLLLTRAGLPEPEINRRTYDARGRYLGKPDLRYRWCKVAVEYEGDEHRRDRRRFRNDILRRERFADAGWRTVRCTGDDLHGRRALEFVARVERCLS